MSSGTPTKAASSPSGEACTGSRIMEQTPTVRATNSELGGWFRGASEDRLLELRPGWQSPTAGCAPPADPQTPGAPGGNPPKHASRPVRTAPGPRAVPAPSCARSMSRRPGELGGRGAALSPPPLWTLASGSLGKQSQAPASPLPATAPPRCLCSPPQNWPLVPACPYQSNVFKKVKRFKGGGRNRRCTF